MNRDTDRGGIDWLVVVLWLVIIATTSLFWSLVASIAFAATV